MTASLAVTGLLVAAAITPGPNNFIVLEAGARRGALAAGRAIAGVVIGSLVLLALVWTGLGTAMQAAPLVRLLLTLTGALYLGWLGATMIASHTREGQAAPARKALPTSLLGVAAFQLFNPKAWMLVTTAVAATAESGGVVVLGVLIALISSLCLVLWAIAGGALSRFLEAPSQRLGFDRAMGALLALSALGLIFDAFI